MPEPSQPSLHVLPVAARTTHDPIAIALAEDIGRGDLTSRYFVGLDRRSGRIFAKEPSVAAGVETAAEVFKRVDPQLDITIVRASGSRLEIGQTVLEIAGSVRSILTAERVALNFLQRLSGVATLTRKYVDAVSGTKARILDTRKTTPGLRALEKAAVVAGGGQNHRFGLFDMVMVKDNHLAAETELRHLQEAIRTCLAENPGLRIELEADTLEQVRRFLTLMGVDVILLDNMQPAEMAEAVRFTAGRVQLEASGGVTLETIAGIAATGVDFISVGALTHSARAVDFSLELT
ncbi:nicotinate-nucleotide pyrophosphorylase [Chthoniobacter flavus Ellin428]|uniref:Probable nicotinate-nucleotide pyrophosphorylase [carboxylating] n=1 Tax=Chthoniobacter flavus Ellin428 TaxID=497964 RepID=B4D7V8_9BACT|nr:carboxylating nicotinate-nucleotide diphosphorylase [Chthoniobacter flavus]EDY17481.1 nicotinate-nucleotide pyrophosphorylase [Chthoniobacter flavus Ellin428]TCO92277.1 nicotinate-nucleotide pyrophosphorylase [carboxylating] [Chthoniobacter flavus]